jgi:hypothetical protein
VNHVSSGVNNPFVPVVLRGGVGARESQLNTVRERNERRSCRTRGHYHIGGHELDGDPNEQMGKVVKGVGLEPHSKSR